MSKHKNGASHINPQLLRPLSGKLTEIKPACKKKIYMQTSEIGAFVPPEGLVVGIVVGLKMTKVFIFFYFQNNNHKVLRHSSRHALLLK